MAFDILIGKFCRTGSNAFFRTRKGFQVIVSGFAVLLFVFSASTLHSLEPGDKAPELQVAKWIKGDPVTVSSNTDKNVMIIEFWAPWAPYSDITFPLLSSLLKEYKDKGISIVSITAENENAALDFLSRSKKVDFPVGVDLDRKTSTAYFNRQNELPICFVIGKDGTILWKGHPMDIERVVKKIFNGSFDVDKQKKITALHLKLQEAMQNENNDKVNSLAENVLGLDPADEIAIRAKLFMLESRGQMEGAIPFLTELQAKAPNEESLFTLKLMIMEQLDVSAQEKKAECEKILQQFKGNPDFLSNFAWTILDRMKFGTAPVKIAFDAATLSMQGIAGQADPLKKARFLSVLARAYYAVGKIEKAMELQAEAVSSAGNLPESSEYLAMMDFYKEALKVGKESGN